MKTETLNNSLIEAMKEKVPKGVNLANVLMDTLYIGKEAAYRRLRGEVPFTFTEASIISNALGVSLDRVSGTKSSTNALFGLNLINYTNPYDTYYSSIENTVHILRTVRNDSTAEWFEVSNIIPQRFYFSYDYLSRFLLYKWMYQHEKVNGVRYFSEMETTDKLRRIRHEYVQLCKEVPSSNFIWDSMMIISLINDIKYFASINLVKPEEVQLLKEELLLLINSLEDVAAKGAHDNGNGVRIYVSNINFEASYGYIEAENFKFSTIRVYSINMIYTADKKVFENHKNWIQSLKKYSMLISVSGEMQRIQFFEKQRAALSEL